MEDQAAAKDLIARTGQTSVPVIDIDGILILGFNKEKIADVLNNNLHNEL